MIKTAKMTPADLAAQYAPGFWICEPCNFVHLNQSDEAKAYADTAGTCPHCQQPLARMTWQCRAGRIEYGRAELIKNAKAMRREIRELKSQIGRPAHEQRRWYVGYALRQKGWMRPREIVTTFSVPYKQACMDVEAYMAANPGTAFYDKIAGRFELVPAGGIHADA